VIAFKLLCLTSELAVNPEQRTTKVWKKNVILHRSTPPGLGLMTVVTLFVTGANQRQFAARCWKELLPGFLDIGQGRRAVTSRSNLGHSWVNRFYSNFHGLPNVVPTHDAAIKPATAPTIRTVSVNTWGPRWATVECCAHPLDWQSWRLGSSGIRILVQAAFRWARVHFLKSVWILVRTFANWSSILGPQTPLIMAIICVIVFPPGSATPSTRCNKPRLFPINLKIPNSIRKDGWASSVWPRRGRRLPCLTLSTTFASDF
jgi:hypothetical protein